MSELIMTEPMIGVHVERDTIIITTAKLSGGTHEGDDVTCPVGSFGHVSNVALVAGGVRVDVCVHAGQSTDTGEDLWIVNTFDPDDHEPRYPFVRADASGASLAAIRAAVKAHDDRLNEGVGDKGPKSPDGDDYNEIVDLVMRGVPTVPTPTTSDGGSAGNPRKLKVLLQQYVEKVAEVEIEIPANAGFDEHQAAAYAVAEATKRADTATWKDGDDAQDVEGYGVKNGAGELIWER